jgi:hypothetical protein
MNKKIFDKDTFIKSLEEDETNYDIPSEDEEEFNINFTIDQIREAINKVIEEMDPNFVSLFDISIFLGNVAKKLSSTLKDDNLSFDKKYNIILSISQTVVDELEQKGLINLELSTQFREIFRDGDKYKDILSSFSNFLSSSKEVKQKIIMNTFESLLNRFLE